MKKLLLIFVTLVTFINISYASFPITDTSKAKQDTILTKEIKDYHQSLVKMGIDLSSCKCVSCRNDITPLTNTRELNKQQNQFHKIWMPIIIVMAILVIGLVILFFRWVDSFNKSGGIGVG